MNVHISTTVRMPAALPPSIDRVRQTDAVLAEELAADFSRLTATADAMVWSQQRLPVLIAASGRHGVLREVVREAVELSGAPHAWAIAWRDQDSGPPSIEAYVSADSSAVAASEVPSPEDLSNTVLGKVTREGRPTWSDDATTDARFDQSRSVHALGLRSVGCVPIGTHSALYLADPTVIGRFPTAAKLRLSALCRLAGVVIGARTAEPPPRSIPEPISGIVGDAPAMRELVGSIRAFAPMPWPALVLGETGTGKELVARALHRLSPLSDSPFIAVNCGAIPEQLAESTLFGHERGAFTGADRRRIGLIEEVGMGTLFLDEVGELPPPVQTKLLRVLQERSFRRLGGRDNLTFSGRIVAATHRRVDRPSERGEFREDLYHRLSACVLHTPPLRDRRTDIPGLADYLLERALDDLPDPPELKIDAEAMSNLRSRTWSGNVRELDNVLRGAIARALAAGSETIRIAHLSMTQHQAAGAQPVMHFNGGLIEATDAFQRARVEFALEAHNGNRTRAAKELGVSRQWLHRLIRKWEDT